MYENIKYMITLLKSRKGASAVEYALLVSLIALIIIGAVTLLGTTVQGIFNDVVTGM